MQDVQNVIGLWPNVRSVAEDCDSDVEAVYQWQKRGSIPGRYWLHLVNGAEKRGLDGVTLEKLASIHAKKLTRQRRRRKQS